ncbi:hypothetical protein Tco_0476752, partial [Tanacetum coccineum]
MTCVVATVDILASHIVARSRFSSSRSKFSRSYSSLCTASTAAVR